MDYGILGFLCILAFLLYQTTTSTYTINKIDFHCLIAFEILYKRLRANSRLSCLCSLNSSCGLAYGKFHKVFPSPVCFQTCFPLIYLGYSTIVFMSIAILAFYWHQKIRGRVYINNI